MVLSDDSSARHPGRRRRLRHLLWLCACAAAAPLTALACGSPNPPAIGPGAAPDGGEGDATTDGSSGGPLDAGPRDSNPDAGKATQDGGPTADAGAADAPSDTAVASSDSGGSGDSGWVEAPHSAPIVPLNDGGPVIAAPELVTITYADDTNRATEEAIGAFLPTSHWLATVGKEYGVGAGTSAQVELTENAPGSIEDTTIQSTIAGLITAGTAPDPLADAGAAGGVSPAIYMFYFPATTMVSFGTSALCDISSGGYHYESSVLANGHVFSYAVVQPCPMGLPAAPPDNIAWIASHEFIEACTDPKPVTAPGYLITDRSQPWGDIGGEVGDLCTYVLPQWSEGPYTALQRVYSNASAMAGGPLCIPAPEADYGADVEPRTPYQAITPGGTMTFDITGWSTAPIAPWTIVANSLAVQGTAAPVLSLGSNALQNGQTTQLTVTMPAGTVSQTFVEIYVYSERSSSDYTTAVVGVYTP
jgi:hypothetical protein